MTPEMPPEVLAQLEQLRDIRLPEAVGWWPLAPGWWLLLALISAALLAALLWNTLRKRTARYLALRELSSLQGENTPDFATQVSVLLRRVAIQKDAAVATLKDAAWSHHLTTHGMSPPLAAYLANAPYAPQQDNAPSPDALRKAATNWIRSL